MSDGLEEVRAWFVQFSELLGQDLPADVPLEAALDWFDAQPQETWNTINAMARQDPQLREFLQLGTLLVGQARG